MASLSDLRFTFEPASGVKLDVVKFRLEEALSECFTLDLDLVSSDPAIDFGQVLDQPALFTLWRGEQPVRYVHGIVSEFEQLDTGFRRTRYRALVEPSLAHTRLCSDWRIFQQKSVPDILQALLKEHRVHDYEQRLDFEHATREYCVQPGESDYQFLARLAAEEGIVFVFLHSREGHQLIHTDHVSMFGYLSGAPVEYHPATGGDRPGPALWRFSYAERVRTSTQTQRDYTFKHPRFNQEYSHTTPHLEHQGQYERYDYPGRYKSEPGKPFTATRLLALRGDARTAEAIGDDARLKPGIVFTLNGHPREDLNRTWLPVRIIHEGKQFSSLEEESADADHGTHYEARASLVDANTEWKAPLCDKPRIDGPQIATVVGPPNEEIHCDNYGRVVVQFPWDREGKQDEHSSCWIRVTQNWAGATWGHMAIPRIGQEVVVDFLDGDCDQPIITGRTYSALTLPPYELPRHKTRMTIKSQTHKGEGYNELRFEDEHGQEEIFVHAQKDQNIHVNNDESTTIGNDQSLAVTRDRTKRIGRNDSTTIGEDRKAHVRQDAFTTIDRNEIRKVGNTLKEEIASSHLVQIGENETIEIEGVQTVQVKTALRTLTRDYQLQGTDRITIRGPAGKFVIDSSGVTIDAPSIRLQGDVQITSPAGDQVQAIEAAIRQGSPLIEECPFAGKDKL
ncbi:type VI secretion system Vgr family protein [Zestomonas carbonaria]|uniref:Actin cross-linking toxin VgrG1 n=1 Tax=Zestomonas carbonaria TaxID=2762745 RepID=A0A7U7IBF0_9GAMM|nr:type VI secretion system tip protein TssI/VgrG [Pseudomonas carbonaria]CAD5110410.1 Actin cross-linking toxin VgrG1 [Pseudomonas carbonaria]